MTKHLNVTDCSGETTPGMTASPNLSSNGAKGVNLDEATDTGEADGHLFFKKSLGHKLHIPLFVRVAFLSSQMLGW